MWLVVEFKDLNSRPAYLIKVHRMYRMNSFDVDNANFTLEENDECYFEVLIQASHLPLYNIIFDWLS